MRKETNLINNIENINIHNYQYEIQDDITYIYLYQRNGNKHTLIIDTFNLEKVITFNHKWHVAWHRGTNDYYVRATIYLGTDGKGKSKNKLYYLHKFLLEDIECQHIDHINNNTMDNRMCNLRASYQRENTRNRKGANSNNKSGYRNVCWVEKEHCYYVQLQIDGKNTRLKKFGKDELLKAAKFAEEMRQKYYGEFAGNG
jgi:hypothetical protein